MTATGTELVPARDDALTGKAAAFAIARGLAAGEWYNSETIIGGRGAEITGRHTVKLVLKGLAFVGSADARAFLKVIARNAMGILSPDEKNDVPEAEWPNPSIWHGYEEVWRAVPCQRHEKGHDRRALRPTARPYCKDLHDTATQRTFA